MGQGLEAFARLGIDQEWDSLIEVVYEHEKGRGDDFIRLMETYAKATPDALLRNMVVPHPLYGGVLPGLVQRKTYIEGLLHAYHPDTKKHNEEGKWIRIATGELLRQTVTMELIVSEEALTKPDWLSSLAMHDQLSFLAKVADPESSSRTTVRVIPQRDETNMGTYPELTFFYPHGLGDGTHAVEKYGFVYYSASTDHESEPLIPSANMPEFETLWNGAWEEALPVIESQEKIQTALTFVESQSPLL